MDRFPGDGGPAFPTTKPLDSWGDPNRGMSFRAYVATAAMQGVLAMHADPQCQGPTEEGVAAYAVRLADALITELSK